jgi:hypothetical protein
MPQPHAPPESPTDALHREVEALRPALDKEGGDAHVHIRAILKRGTIRVTASIKQQETSAR